MAPSNFQLIVIDNEKLLAERRAKKPPMVKRYPLKSNQIAAYYGLPEPDNSGVFDESKKVVVEDEDEVMEDSENNNNGMSTIEEEKIEVEIDDDKENNESLNEENRKKVGLCSFTVDHSVLAAFNETLVSDATTVSSKSKAKGNNQTTVATQDAVMSQGVESFSEAHNDSEGGKPGLCSLTFNKTELAAFDETHVSTSTSATTNRKSSASSKSLIPSRIQTPFRSSSQNLTTNEAFSQEPIEPRASSFTVDHSVLAAFNSTQGSSSTCTTTSKSREGSAAPIAGGGTQSRESTAERSLIDFNDEVRPACSLTFDHDELAAFDSTRDSTSTTTTASKSRASTSIKNLSAFPKTPAIPEENEDASIVEEEEEGNAGKGISSFHVNKTLLAAFDDTRIPYRTTIASQSIVSEMDSEVADGENVVALDNSEIMDRDVTMKSVGGVVNDTDETRNQNPILEIETAKVVIENVQETDKPKVFEPQNGFNRPHFDFSKSRLSRIAAIPRYMHPTAASGSRSTSNGVASPVCEQRLNSPKPTTTNQKKPFTPPRKSIAVLRNVNEQTSFKASKVPTIDFTKEFGGDIPKVNHALRRLTLYETPPRSSCKRHHPITPKDAHQQQPSKNIVSFNEASMNFATSPIIPRARVPPKLPCREEDVVVAKDDAEIAEKVVVSPTPAPEGEKSIILEDTPPPSKVNKNLPRKSTAMNLIQNYSTPKSSRSSGKFPKQSQFLESFENSVEKIVLIKPPPPVRINKPITTFVSQETDGEIEPPRREMDEQHHRRQPMMDDYVDNNFEYGDISEHSGFVSYVPPSSSSSSSKSKTPMFSDITFDNSIYSINTPGPSRPKMPLNYANGRRPLANPIPFHFDDTFADGNEISGIVNETVNSNATKRTHDESLLKITAALPSKENRKPKRYVLAKPKLIKPTEPEVDESRVRRSQRTRVRPMQIWFNEKPKYELDKKNNLRTLVDIETVEIKDKRAQKFLTVDPGEQLEREMKLKNQHKKRKALTERMRNENGDYEN